jgi:drug/metabolite transporter (DMT)-like permease
MAGGGVEISLALVSALLFAVGSVLQQKAGLDAPSAGANSSLLLRMARRPQWLAGVASDALGFVAQAAALGIGRIAVVQPLLLASVVFALPLGVWLGGQRVRGRDVAAAALVVAALIGLITIAKPSGGLREAPLGGWLLAAGVSAVVCVPLGLMGRHGSKPRRAAMLGAAAGVLFALSAALTKAVVDELHAGILHLLGSWEPYALAAVGYVSMTLYQLALNTGELPPAIATSGALDPIGSIVLGIALFHETLHATGLQTIATIVALGVALVGMTVLARSEAQPRAGGSSASPAEPMID